MRPKVIVNCAMSADGKIAGYDRRQTRISTPEDMERVKALRRSVDAIMVGVGTVVADDPHLTVKGLERDENPVRVVIDSRGRTPDSAQVLGGRARTLIFHGEGCDRRWEGTESFCCGADRVDLRRMLDILAEIGIGTLMVEGGGELIASLFDEGLVDEYNVFVGPLIIGGRSSPTPADGEGREGKDAIRLRFAGMEVLGEGVLLRYLRI